MKNTKTLIGKVVITLFPYYNVVKKKYGFKARPALVIGVYPYCDDELLVLPIATLKRKEFYLPQFDYYLSQSVCLTLGLCEPCFVRCHKQTIINKAMIGQVICDLEEINLFIYKEIVQLIHDYDTVKLKL